MLWYNNHNKFHQTEEHSCETPPSLRGFIRGVSHPPAGAFVPRLNKAAGILSGERQTGCGSAAYHVQTGHRKGKDPLYPRRGRAAGRSILALGECARVLRLFVSICTSTDLCEQYEKKGNMYGRKIENYLSWRIE